MSPAIELIDVTKRYGSHEAVRGITLSVEPGTVFGLIGPNGAGKTTTLRMLLDVIRPTSGTTRVLGEVPRRGGPELRRRIGYVPGELRLEGRVRGRALLEHFAQISGPVPAGTIETLAERLGVDLRRPVRTLSKGNKQKLGLIQAFMHDPELLVLDEPTSGLDPLVQREFLSMLREARDRGQAVLLSSHILSEIQQTADHVAVLSAGRIVAQGDTASLRIGQIRHLRATLQETPELVRASVSGVPGFQIQELEPSAGGTRLTATLDGGIDPVIKALSVLRVVDLDIEAPDLEESVLRLYGGDAATGEEVRDA